MSAAKNLSFSQGEVNFASNNVLVPYDIDVSLKFKSALNFNQIDPSSVENSKYESIASQARVVFADIDDGSVVGSQRIVFKKDFSAGLLPIYWLPYRQNTTRKITLKDKRDNNVIQATGGVARHFVTSAQNGCTVFIEGSVEHPTVYHINAGAHRLTTGPIDPQKTGQDRTARTTHMERKLQTSGVPSNIANPTKRAGQNFVSAASFNGADYIPDYLQNNAPVLTNANTQYVNIAAPLLGISVPTAQTEFANSTISVEHTALLFGFIPINSHGWEFWYQKRAKVTRVLPNSSGSKIVYCQYEPITQLWPGVANYLFVRGNPIYDSVYVRSI